MAKQNCQRKARSTPNRQRPRESEDELKREVMKALLRGEIEIPDAAAMLRRSARQVYRIKAKAKAYGVGLLAHGNKGRRAPNRIGDETWERVIELARTMYSGVAYAELTEILITRHHIRVGRESLRKQLRAAGISPKRTPRRA